MKSRADALNQNCQIMAHWIGKSPPPRPSKERLYETCVNLDRCPGGKFGEVVLPGLKIFRLAEKAKGNDMNMMSALAGVDPGGASQPAAEGA